MATPGGSATRVVRFATFELARDTGELRNKGVRIKIEGQPLRLLEILLETPGELVTRDELKRRLWPDETFVDFDRGINVAIKRLREALNDSATTPRFIETLPRRGYRFICPLNGQLSPAAVRPVRRRALIAACIIGLAGVLLILDWTGLRNRWFTAGRRSGIRWIAVLPLENNLPPGREPQYLVEGLHDDIITALTRIGELNVTSKTSVRRFGKDNSKSTAEIARELQGVEGLLEGSVARAGDHLRVNLRLVHVATDSDVWADSYERDLSGFSLVANKIAVDLAGALRIKLTRQERAALTPGNPVDAVAYAAYSKGRFYQSAFTADGHRQAIAYFRHAIGIESRYAVAWAQMGASYEFLGTYTRGNEMSRREALANAKETLQRALELDPTVRDAHQTLARIKRGEGDWEGAAREYQRAREVDPKWLGPSTYLLATGRYDEAVAASRDAARRDPLNYQAQLLHGWTLFMAGRYDESIAQLKKTIQLDAANYNAYYELAWNYIKKGLRDEAAAQCNKALALRRSKLPGTPFIAQCGWVYAAAGRTGQALEIARQLPVSEDSRTPVDIGMGDPQGFRTLAQIYDALGDRARALEFLEKSSLDTSAPLRDNRFFSDQMKADPRFQALARRQPGFPPATGALAEDRTKAKRATKGLQP